MSRALAAFTIVWLAAAAPPAAAGGLALASGNVVVEIVPAPDALSFGFYHSSGAPLASQGIRARVVVAVPGQERQELELIPAAETAHVHTCALDLERVETFSLVLRFEHQGRPHVLRFPRLSPYPPYVTEQAPHEEMEHVHVTPHDGFVVVVGDNHAELALAGGRLRLFWYDVAMNQIPARGLEASCFLEPCAGGVERVQLRPVGEHYLEAAPPASCGGATRVALRLAAAGETRTYRFRLQQPLGQRLVPSVPGSMVVDGYGVELRTGASDFPEPSELELRFWRANSLAPVVLRQAPRVLLLPRHGGTLELPPPLRLQADGRWRLRAWLPPGARTLAVQFAGLDGAERQASFSWQGPGRWRRIHVIWLLVAVGIGVGLGALVSERVSSRPDLVRLLGLAPTLRSRLFPTALQWPVLLLFVLTLYRVFQGPSLSVENPGVVLLLGLLLPAVLLSPLVLGRLWCTVCPFTLMIDTARDLGGRSGSPPRLLVEHRWSLVSLQLVGVPLLLLLTGALARARVLGTVLVSYAAVALVTAWLYRRRAFCATLCPLGAVLGLGATAAPHGLERRACEEGCTPECDLDVGGDGSLSAPAGPAETLAASSCYCTPCLEGCSHQPVILRARSPFAGLARTQSEQRDLAGPLPAALLALVVLLALSAHPLWLTSRTPSLALVLAPLALTWLAARVGVRGEAVVPLGVAALVAWAGVVLSAGVTHVGPTLAAAVHGERLEPLASLPLDPALPGDVVAGAIIVGVLFSARVAFSRGPNTSGARWVGLAVVALVAALLLALAVSAFHASLPVSLAS